MSKNSKKDSASVVAKPPLIYAIPLLIGVVIDLLYPIPIALNESILTWIGWILVFGALINIGFVVSLFIKAKENIDAGSPTNKIFTSGPYKFSRNPIYLSFTGLYIATAALFNTYWPLFFLPITQLVMHYGVIVREENYLESKFGNQYIQFKNKVRRWL